MIIELFLKEKKRIFDRKKIIQGHSAIIITELIPDFSKLSPLEKNVYVYNQETDFVLISVKKIAL